jgi:mannose-6-phosphate isomerase
MMKKMVTEYRPWGNYRVIEESDKYKIKMIEVNTGGRLSYQYHYRRSEVWTIIAGIATVTLDGVEESYHSGDTILIPQGAKHRIENKEVWEQPLIFIEVQHGSYFGEDDIVRIEDDYNRGPVVHRR